MISSKFLAISEGRVVELESVNPTSEAVGLASAYRMDDKLCELIIRESDDIVGGIPGFLLASKDGILTPNAGIDKSNIQHGRAVLYPRKPAESARMIREGVKFSKGASVGVVVCDSRLAPTRRGTTGVAVAASGVEAILDLRGKKDLFDNVLKVSAEAFADDLASAAEILMGESDEAVPIVVVTGIGARLDSRSEYSAADFAIPLADCFYMRSLGRSRSDSDN